MANIKEKAEAYEPPQTKNIADLEVVPTSSEIQERIFKEGTEDEFRINVITYEGEEYRVPNSVLKSLKAILEEKPDLKHFKVKKTGEGLKTEYTVITLDTKE